MRTIQLFLISVFVLSTPLRPLVAELPVIELHAVSPAVVQIGAAARVAAEGLRVEELSTAIFMANGRELESIKATLETRPDFPGSSHHVSTGKFDLLVPSDFTPGMVDVQLLGRFGLSNPRRILAVRNAVATPRADNDQPAFAQDVAHNTIYFTTCKPQSRQYFRVHLNEGQSMRAVAYTSQLDSRALPSLSVQSQAGDELCKSRGVGDWPAECQLTEEKAGEVLIVLHDFLYRGGVDYGVALQVAILGGADALASDPQTLELDELLRPTLPADAEASDRRAADGESPAASEDGLVAAPKLADVRSPPFALTGQLQNRPVLVDFSATKGRAYSIEIISQAAGFLTDPNLVLYRVPADSLDKLEQLAEADDRPAIGNDAMRSFNRDPLLTWTAPEDGRYRLAIGDHESGRRAAEQRMFRLTIAPAQPAFEVHAFVRYPHQNPVVTRHAGSALYRGGTLAIGLHVFRSAGFSGPVRVEASDLPEGVACPPVVIPSGASEATIVVEASQEAAAWNGIIDLVATEIGTLDASRVTVKPRAVSFGGIPTWNIIQHRPAEAICLSVEDRDAAPFSVQAADQKKLEVVAGQSTEFPIKLLRTDEAKENCILRPHDLPAKWSCGELTIEGNNSEATAKLVVPADTLPGDYTFRFLCESNVKWRSNPQSLERLEAYLAQLNIQMTSAADNEKAALEKAIGDLAAEIEARKKTSAPQQTQFWMSSPMVQVHVTGAP